MKVFALVVALAFTTCTSVAAREKLRLEHLATVFVEESFTFLSQACQERFQEKALIWRKTIGEWRTTHSGELDKLKQIIHSGLDALDSGAASTAAKKLRDDLLSYKLTSQFLLVYSLGSNKDLDADTICERAHIDLADKPLQTRLIQRAIADLEGANK